MNDENNTTELMLALVRIEGKLDVIDARIDAMAQTTSDHESRLRALESRPSGITPRVFFSSLVGTAAVVGSLAPIVFMAVGK